MKSNGKWQLIFMKKKIIIGLFLLLPAVVQAQFIFTTYNGSVTIMGYTGSGGAVVIPATINGYPVTSIGENAFDLCRLITSLTIGTNVTSIGSIAFENCAGLTNITIPSSVTTIGDDAFCYCSSLQAITLEATNSFYSIVAGVLFDISQTKLIQYPAGKAGSSYIIPNTVTNIGEWAFGDCTNLTSVTIPNSVTSIANRMFESCTSLTNVMIPNSVASIGLMAFSFCSGLTNVTIPSSVTSFGGNAFGHCTNLEGVYFQGNAPSLPGGYVMGGGVFIGDTSAIAYFLPGTTGWGSSYGGPNGGIPTTEWMLPYPLVLNNGPGIGVQNNCFSFTISWATNLSVVVEAATNLAKPAWTPLATNSLTSGTNYFSDSQWMNYPSRFYRVRSQ
jgi:hypothetical protein